jgi:hypothetical protein
MCFVINMNVNVLSLDELSGSLQIFSRVGLPVVYSCDSCQDRIYKVSGAVEGEREGCDGERGQLGLQCFQIDCIFFGGEEAIGAKLVVRGTEAIDVAGGVGMVIAKSDFGSGLDSGGAHLGEKLLGTGDAAEDDGRGRRVGQNEVALDSPDSLLLERRMIRSEAYG